MIQPAQQPKRTSCIDELRGVAVLTMLSAHILFFLGGPLAGKTPSIYILELINFGNTISYTTFLFCFGYALSASLLSKEFSKKILYSVAKRSLSIIFVYYVIAFYSHPLSTLTYSEVISIISLTKLAPFAEFLLPFAFYPIIFAAFHVAFPRFFRGLFSANAHFVVSLALLLISSYIVSLGISSEGCARWLLRMLVGESQFINFPLIPYLPILCLGIAYQNQIRMQTKIQSEKFILMTSFACASLVLLVRYSFNLFHGVIDINFINVSRRFPPTLLFLSESLTMTLAALAIINHAPIISPARYLLCYLGRHSLSIVAIHLMLLTFLKEQGIASVGGFGIIAVFAAVILLSVAFAQMVRFASSRKQKPIVVSPDV